MAFPEALGASVAADVVDTFSAVEGMGFAGCSTAAGGASFFWVGGAETA